MRAEPRRGVGFVALPIMNALPMVTAAREWHGLKNRTRIIASAKLIMPDKVAWALCMGADFVSSACGFMFSLGCIHAVKCGSGHCPTGVTSSVPRLIAGLDPAVRAARVAPVCGAYTGGGGDHRLFLPLDRSHWVPAQARDGDRAWGGRCSAHRRGAIDVRRLTSID
ncbi:MAG TPA: glutamate synthase-related protein [Rhodopila sp.]